MAGKKHFESWNIFYYFFKLIISKPVYSLYYRKRQQYNKKIPRNQSLIVCGNHQNALMDPMAFAVYLPNRNIFMTRADVFKKPLVRKLLYLFNMLPIYRMRDGVAAVKKNEEIFDLTVQILQRKQAPLVIFPEGNHGEYRRLRPLVKGIFRMAFKAQEKYKSGEGVKILPVGVDYNNYQKFRQSLFMNYGEPIEVSEYWSIFEENNAKGINALKERLAEEIRKLMIDIKTEEYYDIYMALRGIYNLVMRKKMGIKGRKLSDQFFADKQMIAKLDETLEKDSALLDQLTNKVKKYATLRDKLNFRDWMFHKKRFSVIGNLLGILLGIILLPIMALGIIANWPQYYIPPRMTGNIKDPQFISTFKWGVGSLMLMAYHIILIALILIFVPVWWVKIPLIVLLVPFGVAALGVRNLFVKCWSRLRFNFLKKNAELIEAKTHHKAIIELMDKIV